VIPYRERWHREGSLFVRAPHMMGMGMGVGFSSPPPWTPAAVPGCILYAGAYQEARATRAEQPTLYTAASDYTPSNAAIVLTDDADVPAGLSGTSIKATCSDAATRYFSRAANIVTGNRYDAAAWIKSDGTADIKVQDGSVLPLFAGPAVPAAWALYAGSDTAQDGTLLVARRNAAAAGTYYFRPVSLVNLSLASYTPQYTTIPGSVLAQATATAQPWVSSEIINGRKSIQFANGDSATFSGSKTPWKFLHDGSAFTHIVVWRSNTFPGQTILGQTVASLSLGSIGYGLHYNKSVSAFDLYIANGSGSAWAINDRFAGAPGAGVVFVLTLRNDGSGNTTCWKNSMNLTRTRYSGVPSYSSSDPNTSLTVGIGSDANLLDQAVYNRCLTDAEVTQIGQYMASQWGITW
jgi:hypothetical protein